MHPRPAVLLVLLCLSAPARADDPLAATLPAESTTAAQRRAAARKLTAEAVQRLETEKPTAPALQEQLFAEAIDDYQRLVEESGDKLLPLESAGRRHCVQARWLCALDLSRLPAPALRVYRNRVDNQARKWLERGAATRDVAALRRVVDEAFCSSHGDDALDLLGDLAFERGHFADAERWWRHIARPAGDADRKPDPADLELTFPDPSVDVARVRAKQILARLFAGAAPERLAAELRAFRTLHPKAEGSLGGRTGSYADTLEALLARREPGGGQEVSWPTFGGAAARGRVLPADPRDPNRLLRLLRDGETHRFSLVNHARLPKVDVLPPVIAGKAVPPQADARRLACHPVIVGPWVVTADGRSVTAHHAVSGATHTWDLTAAGLKVPPSVVSVVPKLPQTDLRNDVRDLRFTLTVADGRVYARLGAPGISPDAKGDTDSYLVCLDLPPGRDARWVAPARLADADRSTVFEGAPVVANGRAYIAATRFAGGQTVTAVRCYPADSRDTPPVRWQQDVCAAPELKPNETRYRHHLLTLAGPNVVYCSHNGAVVALDARTGRPAWAVRYPSRGLVLGPYEVTPRDLAPCVYAAGRLYVAPADHDRLMCLDPVSGRTLWERRVEAVHLLGVSLGRLVFTTPGGIWAVDAATGARAWMQPAVGAALQQPAGEGLTSAEEDGLPSFGRGFLAGEYVFWPTRRRLWVLSVENRGEQPDDLIPGELEKAPPGNIVLGDGVLAVAGTEVLSIFTAPALLKEKRTKEVRDAPASPRARYDLGAAEADAGEFAAAVREFKLAERTAAADFHFAEEARRRQRETLREQAIELRLERRWEEADAALASAAEGADTAERVARLGERAALWEAAGQPARAIATWQHLLDADAGALRLTAIASIGDLIRRHGRGTYADVERRAAGALADAKRPEDLERVAARFPHSSASASALSGLARGYAKAGREGLAAHALRLAARGREAAVRPSEMPEPSLSLPLTGGWQVSVPAGERLLCAATAPELLSADGPRLVCREAKSGAVRWARRLQGDVTWAGRHADAVLAAGPAAVSALTPDDGTLLWRLALPRGGLSLFCSASGRLFFLQRQQRLIAADADTGLVLWQRTAPGATFGGRFLRLHLAGEHLLAQTSSGELWVLDAATGATRHERPTVREAWPRPPLLVDDRCVALVEDARTVTLFDPVAGKDLGCPVSGLSTLASGTPPLLAGTREALVVAQVRNYGTTLQRCDPRTAAARWGEERLVGRTPPDDLAADATAAYVACGGVVSAFALRDGSPLWQTPLPGQGSGWRLFVCRGALVAYPSDVGIRRVTLGWLPGSLSLTASPSRLSGPSFSVDILDPESGQLIQRINLPPVGPQFGMGPRGSWAPSLDVARPAATVHLVSTGLAGSVPGIAFARTAHGP